LRLIAFYGACGGEEEWRRSAVDLGKEFTPELLPFCGACDWQDKGFVSDAPNQIGSKRIGAASINFPERAGPCVVLGPWDHGQPQSIFITYHSHIPYQTACPRNPFIFGCVTGMRTPL